MRDVQYEVIKLLSPAKTKNSAISAIWSEEPHLSSYKKGINQRIYLGKFVYYFKLLNNSLHQTISQNLCFYSGKLDEATKLESTDIQITLETSIESLVLENNKKCKYFVKLTKQDTQIDKMVRLHVEKSSSYENLDWMLSPHSQNEVLAKLSQCPPNLTLREFKNFGALTADNCCLHLYNLYAMIMTEGLAFEEKSVLATVMQILWEKKESDAHRNITEPEFATKMCDAIEQFIEEHKIGWNKPKKLMVAVVVITLIFELNDDKAVCDKIVKILQNICKIASTWIAEIQNVIQSTQNYLEIAKLRTYLVEVCIVGAFTFNVHFLHRFFNEIFKGSQENDKIAAQQWLKFIVTLNTNVLFVDAIETGSDLQMLLNMVQRIGVGIEGKIVEMLTADENSLNVLFQFIRDEWDQPMDRAFLRQQDVKQILLVHMSKENRIRYYVQIDVITGEFLIDHLRNSKLPTNITDHETFKHVFDSNYGTNIFQVQHEGAEVFCTTNEFNGCKYRFKMDANSLIVTDHNQLKKEEYELIPSELLSGKVPCLLIENYSHWWNRERNEIKFRPKSFCDFATS